MPTVVRPPRRARDSWGRPPDRPRHKSRSKRGGEGGARGSGPNVYPPLRTQSRPPISGPFDILHFFSVGGGQAAIPAPPPLVTVSRGLNPPPPFTFFDRYSLWRLCEPTRKGCPRRNGKTVGGFGAGWTCVSILVLRRTAAHKLWPLTPPPHPTPFPSGGHGRH